VSFLTGPAMMSPSNSSQFSGQLPISWVGTLSLHEENSCDFFISLYLSCACEVKWVGGGHGAVVKMPGASPKRGGGVETLRCFHFMLLLGFEPLPCVWVKASRAGFEPMHAVCHDARDCGVESNSVWFCSGPVRIPVLALSRLHSDTRSEL
jgi:hypothetical protein